MGEQMVMFTDIDVRLAIGTMHIYHNQEYLVKSLSQSEWYADFWHGHFCSLARPDVVVKSGDLVSTHLF